MSNSLYERDFHAWANEQAALLRAGRLAEADIENIAKEIESMGRSEKRELVNGSAILPQHLLSPGSTETPSPLIARTTFGQAIDRNFWPE